MSWNLPKICRKNILSIRKIIRVEGGKERNIHVKNQVSKQQQYCSLPKLSNIRPARHSTAQKWTHIWKTHQNMFPVLHQVNICLINDEDFYWWQKIKVSFLLPLCTNDSPDAQGRGNDDVWGVEGCIESHALLQDGNTCPTTPTATSQLTSITNHLPPGGSGTVISPHFLSPHWWI